MLESATQHHALLLITDILSLLGFFETQDKSVGLAANIWGKVPPKKKPHSVSGGAGFLFFSKEVTAYSITGCRVFLILIGSGSYYFYSYFSSGV